MPLYGDTNRNYVERKYPTTKAQYRESIIFYMKHSGQLAQNTDRELAHNPDRLPEMSLTNHKGMPARMWSVAQEMVAEGVARITHGSFESGSVYLVAGENWVE